MNLGNLVYAIKLKNRDFITKANQVNSKFDVLKNKSIAVTAGLAGLVTGIVAVGTKLAKLGMDAEETENKFNAVFKDMSQDTEKWAKEFGRQYGFARTQMLGFLSSIQDTLVPMGMARDAAADMSQDIVTLAADLGSFNNLPTEQVIRDIQSTLVGNTETMRKYGVVITETRMKQFALNQGIIKEGQQLDELQKMRVRYLLMLNDTTDAQGDLARTSDSAANQFRKTKNLIRDIADTLGVTLLPVVNTVLSVTNSVLSAVQGVIEKFTKQKETVEDLVKEYDELKSKEKLTADEKERLKAVTDKLTQAFPDAITGIDDETGAWEVNTDSILENIRTRKLLETEEKFKDRIKAIDQETERLKDQNEVLRERNKFPSASVVQNINNAKMQMLKAIEEAGLELEELFDKSFEDLTIEDFIKAQNTEGFKDALGIGTELQDQYQRFFRVLESYKTKVVDLNNDTIIENENKIIELTGEAEKLKSTLEDIEAVFSGKMSLTDFFEKAAEEVAKVNAEDPEADPNAERSAQVQADIDEQRKRQMKAMAEGRLQMSEAVTEAIIDNIEKEAQREKERQEFLNEQRKRYEMGRVKAVEETKKALEANEEEYIDKQVNRWSQYQDKMLSLEERLKKKGLLGNYKKWQFEQGVISADEYIDYLKKQLSATEEWSDDYVALLSQIESEEKKQADKKKQLEENHFQWLYDQGEISKEEYLANLKNKLSIAEELHGKWSTEYINILSQISDVEKEITEDSKTNWQLFLEELYAEVQDHPMIQLFSNMGFKETKVGQLFAKASEKLDGMIDGFFSKIFGGNWVGILIEIIKQTKSFQVAMKILNAFMKPFIGLVDLVLLPLLKFIANLWNAIMDGLSSISILGWKPFEKLKHYKIDLGNAEEDTGGGSGGDADKDNKPSVNGSQITNLTGASRNFLTDLLRPWRDLTTININIDYIRRSIADIASMLKTGNLAFGTPAAASPGGENWTIQNMEVHINTPNQASSDYLLKQLGEKADEIAKLRGMK